ncbi:MAG: ABC transporter ATP-binding protein [Thaumarchaeota archaeon]|nr:ABC transporter ATP-binding protein [Nitrososphaerota archaeon]
MLKVDNISAGYGKLQILSNFSLEAKEGEVTVVVGPNGSGKSTLLKSIAGLTSLYEGKITLGDQDISRVPPHEIAKRGLAYLPQNESVFTQLSVSENIRMAAYTVPADKFEGRLESAMKMFPQINAYFRAKVSNLSGGERQMVAMIMAMVRDPRVIMFDEPTANLSPKIATRVLETVGSLAKERGLTVLLVEQNARRALEIGDRAYLLVGGKRVFEGGASELLSHGELARMYLGLKAA